MTALRNIWIVFRRELKAQFNSMLAYVFIVIFVVLSMGLTFWLPQRDFFANAALQDTFFVWPPFLLMLLAPAVGMRLWSEEHRAGTIELLLTMPLPSWQAIVGKYLAGLAVIAVGIACTFPIVVTVSRLGDPDNGALWGGYIATFLYGAACLAITCGVSALTRSMVACLIISVAICFFLLLVGHPSVQTFFVDNLGTGFANTASSFSNYAQYIEINRGVIRLDNVLYYVSVVVFSLFVTSVAISAKRS